jgi:bile acid:Na+ symporter, BASS family
MKLVLPAAVFVLMLSIGMSLQYGKIIAGYRRMTWPVWTRLLLATFIVPPAIALLLPHIFPLSLPEMAGLFMVGVAPGAPLMTRNIAKRGFDMHLAAGYQLWGALLTPVMIPLIVFAAGKLYDRTIWIRPRVLLLDIAEKQLLPVLIGMIVAHYWPVISARLQPVMTMIGNVVLTVAIVAFLFKLGPTVLKSLTVWLPVSALVLAIGSVLAIRVLLRADVLTDRTLAICNANRHVGLALLLAGHFLRAERALPAVAAYALIAPLVMAATSKWFHHDDTAVQPVVA